MKLEELANHGLVCFGGEDWWYHNRGHADMQLMRQYASFGRVLYVNSIVMRKLNISEGRMFWRRVMRKSRSIGRGLVKVDDRFWVYSPFTAPVHHSDWLRRGNERLLREQVRLVARRLELRHPLVWVNCPAACDTALALKRLGLVYQRTDRYEDFPGIDRKQITRYDQRLKAHAGLTFFCNRSLYEEERSACKKAAYVDHGVDFDLFANAADERAIPPEMQGVSRPIVGFYGGIDNHTFDLPLLMGVVSRMPDISFVLIGNSSIDCSWLQARSNVLRIPQQPYRCIPHYAKCFDVCIMPWRQNSWIQACNPVKLKEYLALGKPIVTTPFRELAYYNGHVRIATGVEQFASSIRSALEEKSPDLVSARRNLVRVHGWDRKARQILDEAIPHEE